MLELAKADITTLAVDAIVNAANSALSGGGGVDGSIHRAAGPELLAACRALGPCPVGQARTTQGFRLRARLVIHAVGPVWQGGTRGEEALLEQAYASAFARAREGEVQTIAFPAISTGAYRFPPEKAARVALKAMLENAPHFDRIVACLFDDATLVVYQDALRHLTGPREGFVAFLASLASGGGERWEWECWAVTHYRDPALEEARKELVRASTGAGDWSWSLLPGSIRAMASDLRRRLVA